MTQVICGRFGCQDDHLASHCPRKILVTENGKPINQAISNIPKGSLIKPANYSVVELLSFPDVYAGLSIKVLPADVSQELWR
jgi:hypothetical protein